MIELENSLFFLCGEALISLYYRKFMKGDLISFYFLNDFIINRLISSFFEVEPYLRGF